MKEIVKDDQEGSEKVISVKEMYHKQVALLSLAITNFVSIEIIQLNNSKIISCHST